MIQTFCIRSKYLLPCLQIDQSRLIAATVVVIAAVVVGGVAVVVVVVVVVAAGISAVAVIDIVVVVTVVVVIVVIVIVAVVIDDDKSNERCVFQRHSKLSANCVDGPLTWLGAFNYLHTIHNARIQFKHFLYKTWVNVNQFLGVILC